MNQVDPDPFDPAEGWDRVLLGGHEEPGTGDPTAGGKHGQIGEVPSIAADEPSDGEPPLGPGGGRVDVDPDLPPFPEPGPDA